jgi:hypothetical protein
LFDLYDARVGGGFSEESLRFGCEGEACKGSFSAPPSFETPSSSTYEGPGNVEEKPSKCSKGKVKKNGKCVKKQNKKHKKKHHRKRMEKHSRGGGR